MEIIREIPGTFGRYKASSLGRVWSSEAKKFLKSDRRVTNSGYETVCIGTQVRAVHWCIAIAFLGKPKSGRTHVNHKNGDRRDNRIENLEWVTRKENMAHAKKAGRMDALWESHRKNYGGSGNPNSRLTDVQRREIKELRRAGLTIAAIAKKYPISWSQVRRITFGEK